MAQKRDTAPMLGLAAAAFALLVVPALKLSEPRAIRTIDQGPEPYLSAARQIDGYWKEAFAVQYPDAAEQYRTPKIVFVDSARPIDEVIGDYAGYYREDSEAIRIFVEEPAFFVFFVIAHEFGHHAQKLAGHSVKRDDAMSGSWSREAQRQIGVRYELQAECLAGVWARDAVARREVVSAEQVGQWRAAVALGRDSDTHGAAEQRERWFSLGYESGLARDCDTFEPRWETL